MHITEANPIHRLPEPAAIRLRAELPAVTARRGTDTPARRAPHDFLVLCPQPDLAPELFPPRPRPAAH